MVAMIVKKLSNPDFIAIYLLSRRFQRGKAWAVGKGVA
jgi:hypothetical protein